MSSDRIGSPLVSPCSGRRSMSSFQYEFKWFRDDFDTQPNARGRTFENRSQAEEARCSEEPEVPEILKNLDAEIEFNERMDVDPLVREQWPSLFRKELFAGMLRQKRVLTEDSPQSMDSLCPNMGQSARVGIIVTGEWAPSSGTLNVIVGIVRAVFGRNKKSSQNPPLVFGFLGGPQGFARKQFIHLTPETTRQYLNQGGSDLLGFGSLRAIDETDFREIKKLAVEEYKLTSLIFVGGPNELSHAAQLLAHVGEELGELSAQDRTVEDINKVFSRTKFPTIISVLQSPNSNVFVPNDWLPVSLGFDSTRTALAELVGNIAMDGVGSNGSTQKICVIFVKCGSTTVTLEIALHVRPACTVVAEQIRDARLADLITDIVNLVKDRVKHGIHCTTVLVSDKVYECLVELERLQSECRAMYGKAYSPAPSLSVESANLLQLFQPADQARILKAFDVDGTPTGPREPVETLLARLVEQQLMTLFKTPDPVAVPSSDPLSDPGSLSMSCRSFSLGSEGRCPLPTRFDCSLGLSLGLTAGLLAQDPRAMGYLACLKNLAADSPSKWVPCGIPLAVLLEARQPRESTSQEVFTNQELINLAQQKFLRESGVPKMRLRTFEEKDSLVRMYESVRESDRLRAFPKQVGPYQWQAGDGWPLPFAVAKAIADPGEAVDSSTVFVTGTTLPSFSLQWRPCDAGNLAPLQYARLGHVPTVFGGRAICTNDLFTPRMMGGDALARLLPLSCALPGVRVEINQTLEVPADLADLAAPSVVGILFASGEQSPGCHNVVWGVLEGLRDGSLLFGFCNGFSGLAQSRYVHLTPEVVSRYRNQSGFDLLGGEGCDDVSPDTLHNAVGTANRLQLSLLVVVSDADSLLACTFLGEQLSCPLVVVPATVQNDIPAVPISLGHLSAVGVLASVVGSLSTLSVSSKRQWCFVQINFAPSSQLVSQVGKSTNAHLILLKEELAQRQLRLADVVDLIANFISERARTGNDFGVILFADNVLGGMTDNAPSLLLLSLVGEELARRKLFAFKTDHQSAFTASAHALGNIARSSIPNDWDCELGFLMGKMATRFLTEGKRIAHLLVQVDSSKRLVKAVPLASLVSWSDSGTPIVARKKFILDRSAFPPGAPTRRRFTNPGFLQLGDVRCDRKIDSCERKKDSFGRKIDSCERKKDSCERKKDSSDDLADLAASCARIMATAGTVGDKAVLEMVLAGLAHALSVLEVSRS